LISSDLLVVLPVHIPLLLVYHLLQSIPTLLVFKGGQVVNQSVGAKPKGALKQVLDAAIK
jgi:hypothetical protein